MESSILIFFLKASISIAFFYGLYMLLLRNDTFLKLRRFYFLFAILFSVAFPFIDIQISSLDAQQIPAYFFLGADVIINAQTAVSEGGGYDLSISNIAILVALSISVLLLCKFVFQTYSLFRLKKESEIEPQTNYSIIKISDENSSSFSFFKWIFINVTNREEKNVSEIIAHEKVHVRQMHSIDVLIAETLCIVFWWNPFAWLLKREMKTNLEYLADRGVLKEGYDTRLYQYALLKVSSNNAGIPLINNFNVSQLKKRITMMNKKKTSLFVAAKYLLALPIIAGLLMVNCSQKASLDDEESEMKAIPINADTNVKPSSDNGEEDISNVFNIVEQMPAYPGGEAALNKFIGNNLKYPKTAQDAQIQGRVTVQFTVAETGKLENINILRGISPDCDEEVIRVVKSMPNWHPGKQGGVEVPVYFTLPVVFRLTEDGAAK